MNLPWRTLRGRLAMASLAGLLVATVAFTALGVQLVRSQSLDSEIEDLSNKARGIASLMSQDFSRDIETVGEFDPTQSRIATLEAIAGEETELVWVGPNPTPAGTPQALDREVIAQVDETVLQAEGLQVFEYDDAAGNARTAAAAPVVVDESTIGAVVLTRKRSELAEVWWDIAKRVLIAGLLGLIIAVLVSTLLTTRALRPLRRLQGAAIRVGQGDLETRVEAGGTEEVDALASAFNAMVRELRHREQLSREFLMRVTHDLRTPLTAIRGHTQALADGVVPPEMMDRSLAAIDGESERLAALVTDLLDLAKLEARRFRLDLGDVDGEELVRRAFDAHAGEASRRDVAYAAEIGPLPALHTDRARILQILGNLIDNAFRWTPPGGTVTVAAGPADTTGRIRITVTDTGPGVPLADQEDVFEPFRSETTPAGHSGSGLGLAISRQLARALGGDLYVDPAVQSGSRFVLEVPQESRQEDATRVRVAGQASGPAV